MNKKSYIKINYKNALLKGTMILTLVGILCRIIGFFFRIYITRLIGSNGMGIYQLIMPLASVVYAACIAGTCTAITRFTAESKKSLGWLLSGICISLPLSLFFAWAFWMKSDWISSRILMNGDCSFALKMLSLSFPFAAVHSCIGSFFLGKKQVTVPALSQLLEQIVRIGCVILIAYIFLEANKPISVTIILLGNLIGDIASSTYQIISLLIYKRKNQFIIKLNTSVNNQNKFKRIISYSLPLTLNRVLMQLLASGEAVLIPVQLMIYGHSQADSISLYGVLAGMALPFISFPSAITNSLSVMLIPEISEAQSKSDIKKIASIIRRTINLCIYLGLFFTFVFIIAGSKISILMFKNNTVGQFVSILAWICPFQYLSVTLGSILNGLGKTTSTCIVNIAGILLRIIFLMIFVPRIGISGYLYGLLSSQIVVCISHFTQLNQIFHIYQPKK